MLNKQFCLEDGDLRSSLSQLQPCPFHKGRRVREIEISRFFEKGGVIIFLIEKKQFVKQGGLFWKRSVPLISYFLILSNVIFLCGCVCACVSVFWLFALFLLFIFLFRKEDLISFSLISTLKKQRHCRPSVQVKFQITMNYLFSVTKIAAVST